MLNKTLTVLAKNYLNSISACKSKISDDFKKIDGKAYFEPEIMADLEYNLELFPSLVQLLNIELLSPLSKAALFQMPATVYSRLDSKNTPGNLESASKLSARMCTGEYEPFNLFIQARTNLANVKIQWGNLTGPGTIPSSEIDVSIAKVWYQNGYSIIGTDGKALTQELLLKNDNLIKVDETAKTNSILLQKSDGSKYYQVISDPGSTIPKNVKIIDSKVLLPFSIPSGRNKLIWITVHIPDNAPLGKYSGSFTLSSDQGSLGSVPIEITVLPFKLDASRIDYAIYYHGYVDDWNWQDEPFTSFIKSSKQYLIEMKDLKAHGILYPTTYQTIRSVGIDLNLRNQAGLPKDRLYNTGFTTDNPTTTTGLTNLSNSVKAWKSKIAQYGYSNLYVCGIDEAEDQKLLNERPSFTAVHNAGAKVFASGYYTHYEAVGDLLDLAVIQNNPIKQQADLYHSVGHKVYNYRNPMVGVEDPECFRRNYGIYLWKSGYDGTMDYAYQRNYGNIWNDFDIESSQPHPYRDHVFSYPITDGVINTVEWEGMREAVDDVRYLSTLLNRIDAAKKAGKDVSSYVQFVNSIDTSGDLDNIRSQIIDKILNIGNLGSGETTNVAPVLRDASIYSPTSVKLIFSEAVSTGSEQASNYTINNGINVNSAILSSDGKSVMLATSSHKLNSSYTVTVRNVKDLKGLVISSSGNTNQYTYTDKILRAANEGTRANGANLVTKTGSLSGQVVWFNSIASTLTFKLYFPKSATWYAWGRFFFSGSGNDPNSMSIQVDNGSLKKFGNDKDYFNKWHWGGDGNIEYGTPAKLNLGYFSAGQHTISISGREVGSTVMIDQLLLTADALFIPTDSNIKLFKSTEEESAAAEVPVEFALMQNYPNPFNPSTTIKYAIPASTLVTIKVFDILGKEVETLVNEQKEPGFYEAQFNASRLSSGIYIYSIITRDFVQSKKMMLVK